MKTFVETYRGYEVKVIVGPEINGEGHSALFLCEVNGQTIMHLETARFKWLLAIKIFRGMSAVAKFIREHEDYGWTDVNKMLPEVGQSVNVKTQHSDSMTVCKMKYTGTGWEAVVVLGAWYEPLTVTQWWRDKP